MSAAPNVQPNPRSAFVYGCGYLGIRVARRLIAAGWNVGALTRSKNRAHLLASEGIEPFLGDWTDRRSLQNLPPAERTLVAVSYDARSRMSRHDVYVEGLKAALDVISPSSNLVYVSSTGVYHQSDGRWVDESAPCRPNREGGLAHLRAEELLFRRRPERRAGEGWSTVLRMAGLYGPGRVPRVDSIRNGQPIAADPASYLNLIHIDDAANAVLAAWELHKPQRCYLIADGNPVRRGRYFDEIAKLTGSPAVRYGGEIRDRSDTNKRIWNARMRTELRCKLQYPSFREGLADILSDLVNATKTS